MWRLLGIGKENSPAKPAPARGLPASWYRSPAMYQLERRAIFSQKWMLLTHSLRLQEVGSFLSLSHAGFSFFLIRDRNNNINGFHNICRHRAYPVVEAPSGTVNVLSCKYHGWSYGLRGNLAKAPRFDTVEGFDKTQHGLLPIHVHVDKNGFVWANLQAGEPAVKWEDEFAGVEDNPRLKTFDITQEFNFDHYWEMDIDSNWKGVIENYNECYHCPTSHPLIARVSDIPQYRVEPNAGSLEHTIVNKSQADNQFRRSITFYYPTTSVTVTDNFFYIQRMIPVTATTSKIEYEVFRHKNATDEQFENINAFYRQVLEEDKQLCNAAQRNLNSGVFINGELHPEKEKGPLHFQSTVRKHVMDHRHSEEEQGGQEIWPAMPRAVGEMKTDKLIEEEKFCSQLEAASCMTSPELAW